MRMLCGLTLAALGLGASLASAQDTIVPVQNPSFETGSGTAPPLINELTPTNWTKLTDWTFQEGGSMGRNPIAASGGFPSANDGGSYYLRYGWFEAGVEQDLSTTVLAGDTLSVTYDLGIDNNVWDGADRRGYAFFKVDTTYYKLPYDLTGLAKGTWQTITFTTTINKTGNLSLGFRNLSINNAHYSCLDNVSNVTVTPGVFVNTPPTSTGGSVSMKANTVKTFAASNFQFSDTDAGDTLSAIKVTSLPANGTLDLSGVPVIENQEVLVADIGTLTYTPNTNYSGDDTFKFQVSDGTDFSTDATMTVTVLANVAPTTTDTSVAVRADTVKTFAAADFPFSDSDVGDTLSAIKVTSLPVNGTLNVSVDTEILVADIGTLTYTPNAGYIGEDSFNFQVSDGMDYSVDAIMSITVTSDILVLNGSFEITNPGDDPWTDGNWMHIPSPWTANMGGYGRVKYSSASLPALIDGGTWVANMTDNAYDVLTQNLGSYSFNAGDTLAVTFYVERDSLGSGVLQASFLVGATTYSQTFDTGGQTENTWQSYTLTKTIGAGVSDNLSLQFSNVSGRVGWLDNVSNVSVTPGSVNTDAPTSSDATLTAVEDTETTLAESNFGYSDPNSDPLAAVKITSLPSKGTLKNGGTTVSSGDLPLTVAAADIGNLTYQSALYGYGTPYTTIGIAVRNTTGLWSLDALMTVNVTHVNHPPTSTGGSVILRTGTVKTFAAGDFQFSDVDAGDTLHAIKVTSLPTNGTLSLGLGAEALTADIGTLTYTPNTDYGGPDSLNFQVSDGTDFSADATMVITVTSDIIVQNGSFETPGALLGGLWANAAAVWNPSLTYAQTNDNDRFATRTDAGIWYANLSDPGNTFYQDLGVSVNSGDTLAVTFYVGRENGRVGGVMAATFLVDGTPYNETFDTTGLTEGTWQSYTLTKTIANSGALTLRFSNVSDRPWLDNVSNISVTTGGGPTPGSFADWALTNAPGQLPSQDYNNDGVQNGVAYFMGVTGPATNPGLDASNTVTWPKSATYQGTFVVQTSPDLGTWTPADPQPMPTGGYLTYTLPSGLGKQFVRLVVTPN
jgi:hypothetical protein